MLESIGLEFTGVTDNSIRARIPVDHRTVQPYGILHGGATAALAETLGSIATQFILDKPREQKVVGIELNISHLGMATQGWVQGEVTPIRPGRRVQVWEIRNTDEQGKLISIARLTTMILNS
jgi:1,4-dihydroxy-2-naphthoyl-CoA hydrolase